MKLAQLLREEDKEPYTVKVTKRSEINRAVASMGMVSDPIELGVEYIPGNDNRKYNKEKLDDEWAAINALLKKHAKSKVSGLGSGLMYVVFDHKKQLEKIKACLDELADLQDPSNKDIAWPWKAELEDTSWLYT